MTKPMTADNSISTDIVERLRSSEPLPACPFDRTSPHYLTMPDDKPCPFCGQENTLEGPDKCRGADTRIFGEAANEIERLNRLLSDAQRIIFEYKARAIEMASAQAAPDLREECANLQAMKGDLEEQLAQSAPETCTDCGKIDPCDDDCPNFVEPSPPAPLPAGKPSADDTTYYTEGRDAEYFEKLDNADFAWRITRAAQDIVDNDFGPIEDWMPITAMLDGAAKRIAALSPQATDRTAIPAGIYFSAEHDNFYSIKDRRGCGNGFYNEWKSRRHEFPQDTGEHVNAALASPPPVQIAGDVREALEQIDQMPFSMVNDAESLRHTIRTIQAVARKALALSSTDREGGK